MFYKFKLIIISILCISQTSVFSQKSVLADGDIYKIEINETGIYKLDYNFFKQIEGFNIDNIDPRNIAIYGNGGLMLPEMNHTERVSDLEENAIFVKGENDSKFNADDYLLFYAEGVKNTYYNNETDKYIPEHNLYSNSNYYFLKVKNSLGNRINTINNINNSEFTIDQIERLQYYNSDKINLLGAFFSTHGSGKDWYGESFFSNNRILSFTNKFNFADIILSDSINFEAALAVRSETSSKIKFQVGVAKPFEQDYYTISKSSAYNKYASREVTSKNIKLTNETPQIVLELPSSFKDNEAWLDYIKIVSKHHIIYRGQNLLLQNKRSKQYSSANYTIANFNNKLSIWNITNKLQPQIQTNSNGLFHFLTENKLQQFIVFDPSQLPTPEKPTKIINQNIHEIGTHDLLIVYHIEFADQAARLAEHRANHDNLKVEMVEINQIYNEFSSGKCDPTAIRDFANFIRSKYNDLKYLLLFGDGSYDYRRLLSNLPDHNFIPVFETAESLLPIKAFPADDYYALLDPHEGGNLIGRLDIAVGRLPVNNKSQAKIVVDKIIKYDSDPSTMGDWRLNLSFAADDEDYGKHLIQTESISNSVLVNNPSFNHNKIYFDGYQQISTPGGNRYPACTDELNNSIFKGQLIFNYLGHGGPTGWAQERVLQVNDIESWNNTDKLTLMITATCSFAGYDDPELTTAGEAVILNKNGGAVALLTTTRAVFAEANRRLAQEVYNHVFLKKNNDFMGIGEILQMAKNTNKADTLTVNARKFTLLGDPSMRIAVPKYKIITTHINDKIVSNSNQDTIKALSIVKIKGTIVDDNDNIIEDFNGTISPTIYDKATSLKTLVNDSNSSLIDFDIQKSILFKGSASVTNGHFEYEFQVPKDINFSYGKGKISHYASDGVSKDAMGFYNELIIGGTDNSNLSDNDGPDIKIYLNDNKFAAGGYTSPNPVVFLELSDFSGINVTGSSIGHNITGHLDDDLNNSFVMNQYYKASLNDYKSGTVSYPLYNLLPGPHQLTVKAWDIFNNPTEKTLDFIVIDNSDPSLYHVLNYPNPFSTSTNFRFEHGLPYTDLEILCHIYTNSGKLVKTIESLRNSSSQVIDDIHWDGTDDYGNALAKGIYLYKIFVHAKELGIKKTSDFEKIVVLR